MPFPWLATLLAAGGAGASLLGSKMQSNAINQGNEQNAEYQRQAMEMAQQERQRKDDLIRFLMPMMMRDMGVKDPAMLQQMQSGRQLGSLYGQPPQGQRQVNAGPGSGYVPNRNDVDWDAKLASVPGLNPQLRDVLSQRFRNGQFMDRMYL